MQAFKRLLVQVDVLMHMQGISSWELLFALIALEWLLAQVRAISMFWQVSLSRILFATNLTFKRLNVLMSIYVILKAWFTEEELKANVFKRAVVPESILSLNLT
jgi:hypothetical protein